MQFPTEIKVFRGIKQALVNKQETLNPNNKHLIQTIKITCSKP